MMGLKYAFFHWIAHFFLAFLLCYLLKLSYLGYLLVIAVTILIDLDHLALIKKHGIVGTLYLRSILEFRKPRRYPIHRMSLLVISGILSFIFLFYNFLFLGIIFTAIFIHMLWDIFEDAIIFRMGIKHWL